jgi:pilus assembly protein FimV
MAFNKSKALENALKYLNQGKVAQAIAEYQQILRNDAKDQATLMTVGDLFARQGDMTQAIEYFERLAHVYLSDGFNSKAIAIYKKIAKLAPNELAPLERLADLYVQQGVLSEARPLFLQIAEAYLKANKSQKALDVLHRLLDVEPDNLRVQMRLAELYNVMGQKKEAAQTYLTYAQRLFERGELDETVKLIERALEVDAGNAGALMLKAKALTHGGKSAQAITILESHPEANAGSEVTNMLLELELKAGEKKKAADRGRKLLARGSAHYAPMFKVTEAMIEAGEMGDALGLLRELRDPMIDAGEQDKFMKALAAITLKDPTQVAPLEEMVDFCRHTSNSHQLPLATIQLSDACAAAGDFSRAEELLQELIERNKDDERLVERLNKVRARSGGAPVEAPVQLVPDPAAVETPVLEARQEPAKEGPAAAPASPTIIEETLDEDTQRYIQQALTDVDLFSSYGLTQKATHLLENVLERAPRHTPTLERLLDMYLGAGNDRRTAELASQLEQIHRERNDTVNADRFAELRQRYQKAAGMEGEELPPAPAMAAPAAPAAAAPPEPLAQAAVEAPVEEAPMRVTHTPAPTAAPPITEAPAEFEITMAESDATQTSQPVAEAPVEAPATSQASKPQPAAAENEVDLSDEWEAMASEVAEPAAQTAAKEPAPAVVAEPEPVLIDEEVSAPEPEPVEIQAASEEVAGEAAEEPAIEIVEEPVAAAPEPEAAAHEGAEFELELTPAPPKAKHGAATTEDFISELVAEIDDMEAPVGQPAGAAVAEPVASAAAPSNGSSPVPAPTAETLNELAEVFQEFRSELGELGEEDEDLETHYNLGIAYREMGLLDEAIGEFQKVAKAVQKGKPFRYAMNCSTMLGLSFMDKGEPKIAALWYQRALETPGLEQEAVLALKYDLGLALDEAGEEKAALDSFRQVYAMNIDYRDVADRIATLQKR